MIYPSYRIQFKARHPTTGFDLVILQRLRAIATTHRPTHSPAKMTDEQIAINPHQRNECDRNRC
jgi:hypothetical protein